MRLGVRVGIRSLLVALLATPATAASAQSAQAPRALPDSAVRAIDALFADHAAATSPGCAVGVYRDGAVAFAKGYGSANLNFGVPIAPTTRFTVGSVSKQFTAASIALLVRAGRLSLDDDVRKYLPEIPDYGTPIRVRHLVHHTSGLRDFWTLVDLAGWRYDDGYQTRDMLALAAAQRALNNPPGAEYFYSNTGYLALGEIVRRVTGQTLRAFADSAIFRPLGMHDSFFLDDHNEVVARRATAYSPSKGGWAINVWNNDMVGQGGVVTTLADLQKWDENFYTASLGGAPFVAMLRGTEPLTGGAPNRYAFGVNISTYRGMRMEDHSGSTGGYRAALYRFPDAHTTVTLLCNASDVRNEELPLRIADVVLGARLGAAAPAAAPRRRETSPATVVIPTAPFVGAYVSAELLGATWDISEGAVPGQLVARRANRPPVTLDATGPRTFASSTAGVAITFDGPAGGDAGGFGVTVGRVVALHFTRVAHR